MTPERYRRISAVLDRRQPDLTVLLENVHKPHNFSAVLRTCDAVGVFQAHAVTDRNALRGNRHLSAGSRKWLSVHRHHSADSATAALRQRGFRMLAAHLSDRAVDFREADYTQPVAIVLGTEKYGVSNETLALCDSEITVPMFGMVASLNVSVAAAVILYEAQRQRAAAGLYDRVRLDPETYRRTLFQWGYPRLARYYESIGRPFPSVSARGIVAERHAD
ncbi:MAG TPA: tRNA (guanosine(18)-2'-O)-methyltransferase TrmH [Gammaproteobacteria bacterium]|nr:tRNA (guanosine(18)-2'-O)-methyltransferase TrmH [Gammaproteobacteria bacterium]